MKSLGHMQGHGSRVARIARAWRERSTSVRVAAVTGVLAGTTALIVGATLAIAGSAFGACVLPAFLGSVAGLLVLPAVNAVRSGPENAWDPAEWARLLTTTVVILVMVSTQVVPRMQLGGGYSMLGGALLSIVGVVFWRLPQSATARAPACEVTPESR